jgi:hypothetical protein
MPKSYPELLAEYDFSPELIAYLVERFRVRGPKPVTSIDGRCPRCVSWGNEGTNIGSVRTMCLPDRLDANGALRGGNEWDVKARCRACELIFTIEGES